MFCYSKNHAGYPCEQDRGRGPEGCKKCAGGLVGSAHGKVTMMVHKRSFFESWEQIILKVIQLLERNSARSVFPRMVAARIEADYGLYRAEQTLRRDMSRMASQGKLYRVGGRNARRGYVVAKVRCWSPGWTPLMAA